MQPFNIFEFALGALWIPVTLYFVISLFPPMWRRHEFKNAGGMTTPTWLQRLDFVLLSSLAVAEVLADAFHHRLDKLTGINPGAILLIMMLLSCLYLPLGKLEQHLKNRQKPGA
jgi:hypothetical protein